jgi:Fe-S cluster assembly protein SufD
LGTFSLDGGFVRNNLNIFLNGEYAEIYPYGVYILKNKQHIDNHTFISHAKSNCTSNEIYKGIAANQSTGVFDGKILVCKDSQKTQAYQTNKNVLLSNEAKINTKPHLEIYANDVKCSHGASVGQLDNEALFYLRSRGIDKEKAKSMLVYAFLSDVVEKIKIVELKDFIDKLIVSKLQIDN